jgi:hypothetical protein
MQSCKGDAAEIFIYGRQKCSSVAFWVVCGTWGVTHSLLRHACTFAFYQAEGINVIKILFLFIHDYVITNMHNYLCYPIYFTCFVFHYHKL